MFSPSMFMTSHGANPPSDYLAKYIFNGNFLDETGNYNATNNGYVFVTAGTGPGGSNAGVVNPSGGTHYIAFPLSLATAMGTGDLTVSLALKITSSLSAEFKILAAADTAVGNNFHVFGWDVGQTFRIVDDSANVYAINNALWPGYTQGTWAHIIIRYDKTANETLWRLDGVNCGPSVLVAGTDVGNHFGHVTSINNFDSGRLARNTTSYDTGAYELAYLTFYNRLLTDSECSALEQESGVL